MENILVELAQSDNAIIAILAFLVSALAGVIVYQWRYTNKNTVPKWIWDRMIEKVEKLLSVQDRTLTILKERLKKE